MHSSAILGFLTFFFPAIPGVGNYSFGKKAHKIKEREIYGAGKRCIRVFRKFKKQALGREIADIQILKEFSQTSA